MVAQMRASYPLRKAGRPSDCSLKPLSFGRVCYTESSSPQTAVDGCYGAQDPSPD